MRELKQGVACYMHFYNSERFHESLGYETADSIYASKFSVGELEKVAWREWSTLKPSTNGLDKGAQLRKVCL
jgi:hypothetical protein